VALPRANSQIYLFPRAFVNSPSYLELAVSMLNARAVLFYCLSAIIVQCKYTLRDLKWYKFFEFQTAFFIPDDSRPAYLDIKRHLR
jgi:hypothetical protein